MEHEGCKHVSAGANVNPKWLLIKTLLWLCSINWLLKSDACDHFKNIIQLLISCFTEHWRNISDHVIGTKHVSIVLNSTAWKVITYAKKASLPLGKHIVEPSLGTSASMNMVSRYERY